MNIVQKYLIANRVSIFMIFVGLTSMTVAVLYKEGKPIRLANTFLVFVSSFLIMAFSCVINTLCDFYSGVDTKDNPNCDRTLFDYGMTPSLLVKFGFFNVIATYTLVLPIVFSPLSSGLGMFKFLAIVTGLLLVSYFYTAPPFQLKYRALGWVGIASGVFFVPHLLYYANTFTFGFKESDLLLSLSTAGPLFCMFLYNGQTLRDIDSDEKAGILTHCVLLGKTVSYYFWFSFYIITMLYITYISIIKNNIFLNLPWMSGIVVYKIYNLTKHNCDFNSKVKKLVPKVPFLCMMLLSVGVLVGTKN
ncbi:hypothetical protein CYY_001476 [Polysphondylium violaceum]|uniref:UbiA prenyltransferase family protein n=1 Tax=Polysphondylium violaceum TaxID=133409 RepID=A0A8J4V7W4_9MYCE|nr:hypothetical protein CYY_001476 [Polysphondylium violaceum]